MNIVVTGASRGIGYQLVKLFSANAVNTIVAISRNAKRLEVLKSECVNGNVKIIPFDLSDTYSLKSDLASLVQDAFPSVDILINNAGQLVNKTFNQISSEDFDLCYNVNIKSPFFTIQSLMPVFSEKAHILNISSMGGVQGSVKFPGLSAYSSSKGAIAILTECLAEEYKETNWRFNCLAIGAAQTEMLEEALPGYKAPLSAEEMAKFIAKFATEDGKYFNGKVLAVASTTP